MTDAEAQVRRDLAAAYRLCARRGWDDIVWTHLSAALPGQRGAYLINRFGVRFSEVTASSLVRVNAQGQLLPGESGPVNPSGFAIHGCVHAAREEVLCVMHLHCLWGQVLAGMPEGLLPCSQPAMRLVGRLGRHSYEGLAFEPDEQQRMVSALGQLDGLILDNHGILMVGRTVAEAFMLVHYLERAVQIQSQLMSLSPQRFLQVSPEMTARTQQQWLGDGRTPEGQDEWPALLRSVAQTEPDFAD
jgi:ribulose-5-phosphate 4-epimerase/fuculose-1-phosphate aldolase